MRCASAQRRKLAFLLLPLLVGGCERATRGAENQRAAATPIGGAAGARPSEQATKPYLTCSDSSPQVMLGKATGYARCSSGLVHRAEQLRCPSIVPRDMPVRQALLEIQQRSAARRSSSEASWVAPIEDHECKSDEDCVARAHGYCTRSVPMAFPTERYASTGAPTTATAKPTRFASVATRSASAFLRAVGMTRPAEAARFAANTSNPTVVSGVGLRARRLVTSAPWIVTARPRRDGASCATACAPASPHRSADSDCAGARLVVDRGFGLGWFAPALPAP